MKPFKILHLSDLHLTADINGRRFEPKIGRLSGMNDAFKYIVASAPAQNADLVLVTGDVTDRGDIEAWSWFYKAVQEAGLESRTLAIIGNHDVCCLNSFPRMGSRKSLSKVDLERAYKGLQLCNQPFKYPWAKTIENRIVVFGIDTNNSGNWNAVDNAVGRIGERQLQTFSELLAKHIYVPVKIVTIHHSPNIPAPEIAIARKTKPMSSIDRRTHQIPEKDRREFRRLCVASRVRLILHGHLHVAEERRVNGIRIIGAPASTEPIDENEKIKRYRLYQYSVLGRGGRVDAELTTI